MNITLYFAPISCAIVPYITLTEAGADFEVKPINIRGKSPELAEFNKLNPKHKVPYLIVDEAPLSENVAIQLWIARSFPKAGLLPSDTWQEAQAISLLAWFASGIHPNISRYNSPLKFCDVAGTEDSVKRIARESLLESFKLVDSLLVDKDYFLNEFSAADAYFFWAFRRSGLFDFSLDDFQNCQAHQQRILERPSVQAAIAYENTLIEKFNLTP
ncbi:glutathione S-transferase family protein [Leucothrix arctica]|uniref:Glutathione S-transferase n=1 Tax=Leucothrix arctica TaxID=1481894 RepID=A0A317C6T7_9GAMM|nr:glutathione S-transferase N-terminal domain-containing protein [Leucothrix arctica]PWQ93123.1 hypothetical protein DKT75_20760 [Leucothrix arctica]